MQQYIDSAQKVIPKNLTAYFNTVLGAVNIFQTLSNKFYPEYMEVQNAKNFQIEDPTAYSSIYQGNTQLENNKRRSRILKTDHYEKVDKFLEKYNFDKQFNSQLIGQHFYDKNLRCCLIDLLLISNDISGVFYEQSGILDKVQWLNQAMDEVSLILLEYFKGQFQMEQIFDEYIISFSEIQSDIYKKVNKRAKQTQKDTYIKLKQKIKQYFKESNGSDLQLQNLCQLIKIKNIPLLNAKVQIENQYQNSKCFFQEYLSKNYSFNLTNAIIYKYNQKLRKNFMDQIQESFVKYLQFNNVDTTNGYLVLIQFYFQQYFLNQSFVDGITNQEINTNLQYLIYSIDWIQSSVEADQALILLEKLSQLNTNVSQSKSQLFKKQQFSLNLLVNFKNQNKQRCENALQWWNQQVDEDLNLQIICQIYIILTGFKFIDNRLVLGAYQPANRNVLTLIIRQLNNLKYQYFNIILIKLCEQVTHNIQLQILNQIQQSQQNQQDHQNQKPLYINLACTDVPINLFGQGMDQTQINMEYFKQNEKFYTIITQDNGGNQQLQKEYQFAQISKHFDDIKQQLMENQNKKKANEKITDILTPPSFMYFQLLSKKEHNSNVVTICISGFLSGDENKQNQWGDLLHSCQGTVVGLHWNCSESKELYKILTQNFAENVLPQMLTKINLFGVAISAAGLISQNPYEKANQEAQRVGRYLAYLIAYHQLFGDRQINIICHSLGSVIVLECIKELDKIFESQKKQYINEIMIMGGVVDVYKLQKRRWNAVAGRIYNFYSKKDQILNRLLSATKIFDSPCGLRPVHLGYKQIINFDFTDIIDGHCDYWKKLIRLLMISDFNNDFKFMTNSIKEIF